MHQKNVAKKNMLTIIDKKRRNVPLLAFPLNFYKLLQTLAPETL